MTYCHNHNCHSAQLISVYRLFTLSKTFCALFPGSLSVSQDPFFIPSELEINEQANRNAQFMDGWMDTSVNVCMDEHLDLVILNKFELSFLFSFLHLYLHITLTLLKSIKPKS